MDCRRFEETLFRRLEGVVDPASRRQMTEHAAGCAACRQLEVLAGGDGELPGIEPPAELLAGVLAHTSGAACELAQQRLCEADDLTRTSDDASLQLHLRTCGDCTRIAAALALLEQQLPLLAEMRPDAGFVDQVLAATRPRVPLFERLDAWWEDLVQRPRLAFEGAYLGTVAIALVVMMPASPLPQLSSRLVSGIEAERAQVQRFVVAKVQAVASASRASVAETADRLVTYVVCDKAPKTWRATLACWRQVATDRAGRFWSDTIAPLAEWIRSMWHAALSRLAALNPAPGENHE